MSVCGMFVCRAPLTYGFPDVTSRECAFEISVSVHGAICFQHVHVITMNRIFMAFLLQLMSLCFLSHRKIVLITISLLEA